MPGYYFDQETIDILNNPLYNQTEITLSGLKTEKHLSTDEFSDLALSFKTAIGNNSSLSSITIDTLDPDIIKIYLSAIQLNQLTFGNTCKINKLTLTQELTSPAMEAIFNLGNGTTGTTSLLPSCITDLSVRLTDDSLLENFTQKIQQTKITILRLNTLINSAKIFAERLKSSNQLNLDFGRFNKMPWNTISGYTLNNGLWNPPVKTKRIDKIGDTDKLDTVNFLRDFLDTIPICKNGLFQLPILDVHLQKLTPTQVDDFFNDLNGALATAKITTLELTAGSSNFFSQVFQLINNNQQITKLVLADLSTISLVTLQRNLLTHIEELTVSLKREDDKGKLKVLLNSKASLLNLSSVVSFNNDIFENAHYIRQINLTELNEEAANSLVLPPSVELVFISPMNFVVLNALAERISHHSDLRTKKYVYIMFKPEDLEILSMPSLLHEKIYDLENENTELDGEHESLASEIKKVKYDKDVNQLAIETLNDTNDELNATIQRLQLELANSHQTAVSAKIAFEQQLSHLVSELQRANKDKPEYQTRIQVLETDKERLDKEVMKLTGEKNQLRLENAAIQQKHISLQNELRELSDKQAKSERVQAQKTQLELNTKNLKDDLDATTNDLSSMQSLIARLKAEIVGLDQENKNLSDQIRGLSQENSNKQTELNGLYTENGSLKADNERLAQDLSQLETRLTEANQSERELLLKNNQLEREVIVREAPATDSIQLSETLLALKNELDQVKQNYHKAQAELAHYKTKLSENTALVTQFEKTLSQVDKEAREKLIATNHENLLFTVDNILRYQGFHTFTELCNLIEKNQTNGVNVTVSEKASRDKAIFSCHPRHLSLTDSHGSTVLHLACDKGNVELAKLFLEQGAKQKTQNYDGQTPLHLAVAIGSLPMAELLAQNNESAVNVPDFSKKTPFHYAVALLKMEIINHFLANKDALELKVTTRDDKGYEPFITAAIKCIGKTPQELQTLLPLLEKLINSGANVNAVTDEGESALSIAVEASHSKLTSQLLLLNATPTEKIFRIAANKFNASDGADTNYKAILKALCKTFNINHAIDEEGNSFLYQCIKEGKPNLVRAWLKLEASVKIVNNSGKTALHIAAGAYVTASTEQYFAEIVNILLNHGATLDTTTTSGVKALDLAVAHGSLVITSTLLNYNPRIYGDRTNGQTIFHSAASSGNIEMIRTLFSGYISLKLDTDINNALSNLPNNSTEHPLDYIFNLRLTSVKNIFDSKDDYGRTLVFMAVENRHYDLAQWLIERGADATLCDNDDNGLWHLVAKTQAVKFANYLLDQKKSDCTKANKAGDTPLAIAKGIEGSVVYKLLVNYQAFELNTKNRDNHGRTPFWKANSAHRSQSLSPDSSNPLPVSQFPT